METRVKVTYTHRKKVIVAWDKAIDNALFDFGLVRTGSGYNLKTGVRDLTFQPETEEEFREIHG